MYIVKHDLMNHSKKRLLVIRETATMYIIDKYIRINKVTMRRSGYDDMCMYFEEV